MANPADNPETRSGPSKTGAGFNVTLSSLALLAIVIMVNYIALRNPAYYSLSKDRFQPLSPVTMQMLTGFTNDVDIIVYYDPEAPLFTQIETMLRQYREANRHVRIETVDYIQKPARAEEIRTRYQLGSQVQNAVIFANGDNVKIVKRSELSDYNVDELVSGRTKQVRRKSFKGESVFTAALLSVLRSDRPMVAYLTGYGNFHNPTNFTSDTGYGRFSQLLRDHNASVGALSLAGTNDIPAVCKLIVVPGVETEIPGDHLNKLDRYLESGGRMLMLFKYGSRSGIERLLYRWGVQVEDRQVVDRARSDRDTLVLVGGEGYSNHEIMRPLTQSGAPIGLAVPRPVKSLSNQNAADGPQVTILASTSPQGIAISDYRKGIRHDPRNDERGIIPLVVAVEKGDIVGFNEGSTRMVVIGDSHSFNNQFLSSPYANHDLAWNTVSWLLDQSRLLGGIPPRPVTEFQINLTDKNLQSLQWILLAGIPGGILLIGWIVWLRRQM